MSLARNTAMRLSCILKMLLKKLKKNIRPLNGRPYIAKVLIRLPKTLFPSFRVIVNPAIIETNRKTLNFFSEDSLDRSFSTEYNDSVSTSEEEGRFLKMPEKISLRSKKHSSTLKKCCKHCHKLYYPKENVMNGSYEVTCSGRSPLSKNLAQSTPSNYANKRPISLKSNTQPKEIALNKKETLTKDLEVTKPALNPQIYSTPTTLWSDEVEQELQSSETNVWIPPPPPMPVHDFLNIEEDEFLSKTPLRRVTIQDIQSVKLKPPNITLTIPKTPEVHDMMAVLRKRFAAMHSPLFGDVTVISSDSDEDFSDFYSDFSHLSWGNQNKFQIGVM